MVISEGPPELHGRLGSLQRTMSDARLRCGSVGVAYIDDEMLSVEETHPRRFRFVGCQFDRSLECRRGSGNTIGVAEHVAAHPMQLPEFRLQLLDLIDAAECLVV